MNVGELLLKTLPRGMVRNCSNCIHLTDVEWCEKKRKFMKTKSMRDINGFSCKDFKLDKTKETLVKARW